MLFLLAFFAISIPLSCLVPHGNADAAGRTFAGKRIIFEEDVLNWTSKETIDDLLSRINRAGFNAFSPIVWHGRGTTWPSQYAEWDSWLTTQSKQSFDPLKYLIDRAHSMGIEVHPWF